MQPTLVGCKNTGQPFAGLLPQVFETLVEYTVISTQPYSLSCFRRI